MKKLINKIIILLDSIKVQHSVFALPFALTSALYASGGQIGISRFLLILACMLTARNSAMIFNRLVDKDWDALNPRTKSRAFVTGALSTKSGWIFLAINSFLFLCFSYKLSILCLILSPFTLAILLSYSLTKRWSQFTQIHLGVCLGLAPIAAWVALTGSLSLFPILLGLGVLFWVAGFDLIYSTQDYEFDKAQNLKNLVVSLGIKKSLKLSELLHLLTVVFFLWAGLSQNCSWIYHVGVDVIALILLGEHLFISPQRLDRVNVAFFTFNGFVSLIFLFFSILDIYVIPVKTGIQ